MPCNIWEPLKISCRKAVCSLATSILNLWWKVPSTDDSKMRRVTSFSLDWWVFCNCSPILSYNCFIFAIFYSIVSALIFWDLCRLVSFFSGSSDCCLIATCFSMLTFAFFSSSCLKSTLFVLLQLEQLCIGSSPKRTDLTSKSKFPFSRMTSRCFFTPSRYYKWVWYV